MSIRLILGTKNPGKLKELFALSQGHPWLELELAPNNFQPDETGTTFAENAIIKAQEAARLTGILSLGEDSGIRVDALGGQPGIYSARYCEGSDDDRLKKLLKEMSNVHKDKRGASYISAMALAAPDGEILQQSLGKWFGSISFEASGENGFGYDPIFFLPDCQKTAAQLTSWQKNQCSHRAKAWQSMLAYLQEMNKTLEMTGCQ